jgi:uncharacterized protein
MLFKDISWGYLPSERVRKEMHMHTWLDVVAIAIAAVGALNWALVAAGRFDLVATITGNHFGETNGASRAIYGLVGLAGIYALVD